MEEPRYYPF